MIYLSNLIIPIFTLIVIIYALCKKIDVYSSFISGVKEGIDISFKLFPTIFAMSLSIAVFIKSNILNDLISLINIKLFPKEILPIALLRSFSGSSSLIILNDILKTYGPDSLIGRISSVIQSSTDTTIYILSTYYTLVGIKKIKYSLVLGLLCDIVCVIISILIFKLI